MLKEHLDKFIIVYLDNIIIYFKIEEEYYKYIKWILQRLADEKILIAIKKYKFHTIKTEFYRFIMELGKLSINLKKIKAVLS